jgi:hypothetical protein
VRRSRLLVLGGVVVASLGVTGVSVATAEPELVAAGEGSVSGTDASAVFGVADRSIRQVRYVDGEILSYTFTVENDGWRSVTVTGLRRPDPEPRLFSYRRVVDEDGASTFSVPARGSAEITVEMLMRGCETLSARAGSFATEVELMTEGGGSVVVDFPEEVRAGSPREAGCANATATSRPRA